MATCQSKNFSGHRCARNTDDAPYFIYHDARGRITGLKNLCQEHSNVILGSLMEKELGYTRLLEQIKKRIDGLYHDLNNGDKLADELEKIKQARLEGRPRPTFKKIDEIKKEIKVWQEKRKRHYEIRNNERNNTCRFCGFPLAEPQLPNDQLGTKYSHADFHSSNGKRRADIMFHTECGITWLTNKLYLDKKELRFLQPKRTGQHTIFSSTTSLSTLQITSH